MNATYDSLFQIVDRDMDVNDIVIAFDIKSLIVSLLLTLGVYTSLKSYLWKLILIWYDGDHVDVIPSVSRTAYSAGTAVPSGPHISTFQKNSYYCHYCGISNTSLYMGIRYLNYKASILRFLAYNGLVPCVLLIGAPSIYRMGHL